MIKYLIKASLLLTFACFSFSIQANNDEKESVTLAWLNLDSALTVYNSTRVFSKPQQASGARQLPSSGKITIQPIIQTELFNSLKDRYDIADNIKSKASQLPIIDFNFVIENNYIVPSKRSVQRSEHPIWEWQISPGVFWTENNDNGFSRVAFPFSLQEKNANCTHNGLMLFAINAEGKTTNGIFQITSETCAYFQFDWAARVTVDYKSDNDFNAKELKHAFQEELKHKIFSVDKQKLIKSYPKLRLDKLKPVKSKDSTTSGLLVNNQHYRLNCETRYGPYPYCDWLALPSYSTAKSIFAGLALMRLQALVPNIDKILVTKMIPECQSEQWENVTLSDLINMRTGNYYSKKPHGDEASSRMIKFFFAITHQEKLQAACNMFPNKSKPGNKFKYHTSDTYLAGVMLDKIFAKVSDKTDVYQSILVDDLWKKIHLSPLLDATKRTYDDEQQAFAGWGLTYYADDVVKLASFLLAQKQTGKNEQLLDSVLFNSAMQNGEHYLNRGGGEANIAYNNGFWALEVGGTLGCKERKWLPFMSGYGGITVAMISPDLVYYNYADSGVFRWLDIIVELNNQFPLCEVL